MVSVLQGAACHLRVDFAAMEWGAQSRGPAPLLIQEHGTEEAQSITDKRDHAARTSRLFSPTPHNPRDLLQARPLIVLSDPFPSPRYVCYSTICLSTWVPNRS